MFWYTNPRPTFQRVVHVIYRTVPLYDIHTPDAERLHRDSLLIIESQEDKSLILVVVSEKFYRLQISSHPTTSQHQLVQLLSLCEISLTATNYIYPA
jgi:hypothetical protein